MGCQIRPAKLRASLESLKRSLEQTRESAVPYLSSIQAYVEETTSESVAIGSQKDYMKRGHLKAMEQQMNVLDTFQEAIQKHISLIDMYLSGYTSLDEDKLEDQLFQIASLQDRALTLGHTRLYDLLEELRINRQRKVDCLQDFCAEEQNIYHEVDACIASAESSLSFLKGTVFCAGTNTYCYPIATTELQLIDTLFEMLPVALRKYLSKEDIQMTDDGFFICTKSLADILLAAGFTEEDAFGDGTVADYDDWYLMGIFENKDVTYTVCKLREPDDEQGNTGASLPFVSLPIESLTKVLKERSEKGSVSKDSLKTLENDLDEIIHADSYSKVNKILQNYFKNAKSEGSYLLADIIVNKTVQAAEASGDGYVYKIRTSYDENDKYCKAKLDSLAENGVYDRESNSIYIKDRNNLTQDEYDAILSVTTGNPDIYSYAAEKQYHAENADCFLPFVKTSAIKSDAGVGESKRGSLHESNYKAIDGTNYKKEKNIHESHEH